MYFEEPKSPQHKIRLTPNSISIKELPQYFYSVMGSRDDSYHHFKASYWLMDYNDLTNFSVEASLKIYFDEHSFRIDTFIGQPLAGGMMAKLFHEAVKSFFTKDEDSQSDSFKNYTLLEMEYDEPISQDGISSYVKQISDETLEYIKLKINKSN